MIKAIIIFIVCLATNFASSQTLVKLALPDNCNALNTNTVNLKGSNDSKIEIFPNPNLGIFTLVVSFKDNINKAIINVYDINSKSVYSETVFSNSTKLVKQLNISNLKAGNYLFEVKNVKTVSYFKLVINNK